MHTGQYDGMIAMTMAHVDVTGGGMTRRPVTRPTSTPHGGPRDLRYGENPHQHAQLDAVSARFGRAWKVHQGKELSYTNLLDLDAALRIALEFTEPAAAVIKHTNPCGVATGATIDAAYVRARDADPLSAFGGIVGLNRQLDAATARALTSTFIEAVIAPSIDERGAGDPRGEAEHACRHDGFLARRLRAAVPRDRRCRSRARFSAASCSRSRDRVTEAADPWPSSDFPKVVTKRAADRRGMDRAAVCVARLRAREVEHGDLHRRGSHARGRRRADEPRRRGEGRGDEGGAGSLAGSASPRPTRSFRSATASTPLPTPAPPLSCSRADRFETRK